MLGHMGHTVFNGFAASDVANHPDKTGYALERGGLRRQDPDNGLTGFGDQGDLQVFAKLVVGQLFAVATAVFGKLPDWQGGYGDADDIAAFVTRHGGKTPVDVHHQAVSLLGDHHAVRAAVKDQFKVLFGFAQFGGHLGGHDDGARAVAQQHPGQQSQHTAQNYPVAGNHLRLVVDRRCGRTGLLCHGQCPGAASDLQVLQGV